MVHIILASEGCLTFSVNRTFLLSISFSFLLSLVNKHKTNSSPSMAFPLFQNFYNCLFSSPTILTNMLFLTTVITYTVKFLILIVVIFLFSSFFTLFLGHLLLPGLWPYFPHLWHHCLYCLLYTFDAFSFSCFSSFFVSFFSYR